MAQLCIRIASQGSSLLRTQPGDVVEIVDDAHQFSLAERSNGQYRIISVPGPQELYAHFKQQHYDVSGELTHARRVTLDVNALRDPVWRDRTTFDPSEIAALTRTR